MSDYDNKITIENAKVVKELYLRNLTDDQSAYIKKLSVRFQEVRSVEAARRALFGYLEVEERCENERNAKNELQKQLAEERANFKQFKAKVSNHFSLEAQVLLSRESLLEMIDEPRKAHAVFNPNSSLKVM